MCHGSLGGDSARNAVRVIDLSTVEYGTSPAFHFTTAVPRLEQKLQKQCNTNAMNKSIVQCEISYSYQHRKELMQYIYLVKP